MGRIDSHIRKLKNGVDCTFRTCMPSDAAAMIAHLQVILQDGEGMVIEPDESKKTLEEEQVWIQEFFDHPNQLLVVAEVDGKIIGNIDVHAGKRRRLSHVSVFGIGMHPDWRSQGVGKALFDIFMQWIATRPELEKISLRVLGSNTRAINLYKKYGFAEDGRHVRGVKLGEGRYEDDVSMSLFVNGGRT